MGWVVARGTKVFRTLLLRGEGVGGRGSLLSA